MWNEITSNCTSGPSFPRFQWFVTRRSHWAASQMSASYVGWPQALPLLFFMQSEEEICKLPICLVTQGQIRRDSRTNTVPGCLPSRNSVFTECSICNLQYLEYFGIHIPKHRARQNYQIVQGIPPQGLSLDHTVFGLALGSVRTKGGTKRVIKDGGEKTERGLTSSVVVSAGDAF